MATINQHFIEEQNRDVMIISLPRLFDSNDFEQRLIIGAQRAYAKGSSFRAVINFDYTLRHISSLAFMYGQLDGPLMGFPRNNLQHRIGIVVSDVTQEFVEGGLRQIFDGPIRDMRDLFKRAIATVIVAGDGALTAQGYQALRSFQDPWIAIHPSQEKAIEWCIKQAPWP